jgi:gliding motility-associated-like protein
MRTISVLCILLMSTTALAQSFYNKGSSVVISSGTVFTVADSLVNTGSLTNNGNMVMGGVWLNQGTYNPGTGEITFNSPSGATAQVINHNSQAFSKLTISGGGEKIILADMTINGELVLLDGIITQQNNSSVIFDEAAVIVNSTGGTGGSDASHIKATVYHKGAGDKLFPLGNGIDYLPVQLNGISGSTTIVGVTGIEITDETLDKKPDLAAISNQRYWMLDVASGSLDGATVTLPVEAESIVPSDISKVVVAQAASLQDPFESLGNNGSNVANRVTSGASPTLSFLAVGVANENTAIEVYNALSPNSDDKNEYMRISNIQLYPNNQVRIFNRWGDAVFEMNGYDNDEPARRFNGRSNVSGEKILPPGTYFYTINLGDGSSVVTGYLALRGN